MNRRILLQQRKEHNLTQQQLAEKLGISTVYVRKIEKGVVNPGRVTMVKYEHFFNSDMKELFPDLFLNFYDKNIIKDA
ncbi:helix-turn-helix transcriptional regulator [Lentibacillus sp.]|uniref:helix-turn-helix transcriptional regulator n=1 Tax=Lentibacillus sp. TaxID=1925746 RepID=UPI002B4B4417|nr:helix-turn-helix transcriptional regulator [Lentibacillus sp.]HLS10434.1 helix-turn-helix transcriptional regulator [Lentibacillus sp.]